MPLESLSNPEARLSIKDLSLGSPEREWNLERELKLREQYDRQVNVLRSVNLLERLPSGQEGIIGITGVEYPLPSYETITAGLAEKADLMETKANQGFTRLLIVPFGRKLADLEDALRRELVSRVDADPAKTRLFRARRTPQDERTPITALDTYENGQFPVKDYGWAGADESGDLIYDIEHYPPKDQSSGNRVYDQSRDGGQTKQNILESGGGWEVILIEERPDIPRDGDGQMHGGRKQLETKQTPEEYLDFFQKAATGRGADTNPYRGEGGMTPEASLVLALTNLAEKDEVTDDYDGRGSINYNVGSYLKSSGNVPGSYWSRGSSRVNLDRDDPGVSDDDFGVRPSVRIPLIPLELRSSSSLQPLSSPSLPETRKF